MHKIDVSNMDLVHYGREWEHPSLPCSRDMTPLLEKEERFVFWLQPRGGNAWDQVPALKVGGDFYTLSLRMMKAIWRNVRLRKGFTNVELTHSGSYKLVIPTPLLSEKLRTQTRFSVMRVMRNAGLCSGKGVPSGGVSKGGGTVEGSRDLLHYVWDKLEPHASTQWVVCKV